MGTGGHGSHPARHVGYCEACDREVAIQKPHPGWHAANVAAWAFILVGGPFLAVMPPLNLLTMPVFIFVASAFVGFIGNKLGQAPSCPRCGRDVPLGLPATKVARRAAGPADEGLVKGALVGKA